MKLSINKFKAIPDKFSNPDKFGFCIFGKPSQEILNWSTFHSLEIVESGPFTNFYLSEKSSKLSEIFEDSKVFDFLDGFSPNLNKHLHIGHFSNLVFGKAFKSLGIAKQIVAIFGDTLEGNVSKEEALCAYELITYMFDYKVNQIEFASNQKAPEELLVKGKDAYEGTLGFQIENEYIVGIKSSGATSYFYQDVALASKLSSATLYLTGSEQKQHFESLKKMFPAISHIPLGLVLVKKEGKMSDKVSKMSSREGNVIFLSEILKDVLDEFHGDVKLAYNVLAGFFLKSNPSSEKIINLEILKDPKQSQGLYLSYTLAKLQSAGCEFSIKDLEDPELLFSSILAKTNLNPSILFEACYKKAKHISKLYETHIISGNSENKIMFEKLANELLSAMNLIGLYNIKKV